MASVPDQFYINDARDFAEKLASESRLDVSAKILKVDEACRSILQSGGLVSMRSVRAWLSTNTGVVISPQTLMNKRLDKLTGKKVHSPFRRVIDRYSEVQSFRSKKIVKPMHENPASGSFMSESELAAIPDHQTRYKVQLLVGRVRNLQNQINNLRQISTIPPLSESVKRESSFENNDVGGSTYSSTPQSILGGVEREAIEDFLKLRSLKRRGLSFDEFGRLNVIHPASKERSAGLLSAPALKAALDKILATF